MRLTTTNKDVTREMICRNEDCGVTEEHCPHLMEDECACLREAINKLAEYEDAEEQCIAENQCGLRELLLKWKEFFDDIAELYDYRKAEEQGLLLRLPCKVGDTVYLVCKRYTKCTEHGIEYEDYSCEGCECLECDSKIEYYIHKNRSVSLEWIARYLKDFGKTVFLTREEAESALAEKGGA